MQTLPELKAEYQKKCLDLIGQALEIFGGNKTKAAIHLNANRTTLIMMIKNYSKKHDGEKK